VADIAFIFHWTADHVMAMPAGRIQMWREKAIKRWNQTNQAGE
jgi:hypothetical protein